MELTGANGPFRTLHEPYTYMPGPSDATETLVLIQLMRRLNGAQLAALRGSVFA